MSLIARGSRRQQTFLGNGFFFPSTNFLAQELEIPISYTLRSPSVHRFQALTILNAQRLTYAEDVLTLLRHMGRSRELCGSGLNRE